MRAFLTMERRLQDLETRLANSSRYGVITDVKFDEDKKRWYVKMQDGEGDDTTFKSRWLPWKSFAHATVAVSQPPRKGQKVTYSAPGGQPELAYVEPFFNDPDAPSPNGKLDEIHRLIESAPDAQGDKYEHWKHETDRSYGVTIKKKTGAATPTPGGGENGKAKRERKLPEVAAEGAEGAVQVKTTKDGVNITVNKSSRINADDTQAHMSAGDGKHKITAHKEKGFTTETPADVITKAGASVSTDAAKGIAVKAGEGVSTDAAKSITTKAGENMVSSAGKSDIKMAEKKIVMQGGSLKPSTTSQDEKAKNAIKAKAQADLAADPNRQSVNMSATLPSGATYNYKVTRS